MASVGTSDTLKKAMDGITPGTDTLLEATSRSLARLATKSCSRNLSSGSYTHAVRFLRVCEGCLDVARPWSSSPKGFEAQAKGTSSRMVQT